MLAEIKITNAKSGLTVIDIEGVIGVPEEWQFDEPGARIATYKKFRETLGAISQIRSGEVVVNIRSTGGDVGDALLIYDALSLLQAVITTRCYGYTASAATIIAQAASKGRREISANSLYLVHNAVSSCEGNAGDFRQREELLKKTDDRIASIYAGRSGRGAAEFAVLMSENNGGGRWLSPGETLALGLADRIIDAAPLTEAASVPAENADEGLKRKGLAGKIAAIVDFLSGARPAPVADAAFQVAESSEDVLRWQQEAELDLLRHKITTLESENAQLRAQPTETKTKEDPSPTESRLSANQNAYRRDVESFLK